MTSISNSFRFSISFCQAAVENFCFGHFLLHPTITHNIFENNSSFHVKWRTMGNVYFLFFKSFLLVFTKFLFWQGHWALGYHSMGLRYFSDIS